MKQLLITTESGQRIILNPDHISEISEETPTSVLIQVTNPNYGPPKANTAYVVNESLESISLRLSGSPDKSSALLSRENALYACCCAVQGFFDSIPDLETPPGLRERLSRVIGDPQRNVVKVDPELNILPYAWWNNCKFGTHLQTKNDWFAVIGVEHTPGKPVALLTLVSFNNEKKFKTRNYDQYALLDRDIWLRYWNQADPGDKVYGKAGEYTLVEMVGIPLSKGTAANWLMHLTTNPEKTFESAEFDNFVPAWAGEKI